MFLRGAARRGLVKDSTSRTTGSSSSTSNTTTSPCNLYCQIALVATASTASLLLYTTGRRRDRGDNNESHKPTDTLSWLITTTFGPIAKVLNTRHKNNNTILCDCDAFEPPHQPRPSMVAAALDNQDDFFDPLEQGPEHERFFAKLDYHRNNLVDYEREWDQKHVYEWPHNLPCAKEIAALQLDLRYCRNQYQIQKQQQQSQSQQQQSQQQYCQDLQFRIAAYFLEKESTKLQAYGFGLLQELVDLEHADAMCLYGTYRTVFVCSL
jgi:hypothetical protein